MRKLLPLALSLIACLLIGLIAMCYFNPIMFSAVMDVEFGGSKPLAARIAGWEKILNSSDESPEEMSELMVSMAYTYFDEFKRSRKDADRREIARWFAERTIQLAERYPSSEPCLEQSRIAKLIVGEIIDDAKSNPAP